MAALRRARHSAGFTLVEVMVAIFVLLVGILGLVTLIAGASTRTASNKAEEGATALARELVEAARSLPYEQITPTSITSLLQSQPGLGNYGAGSGWTIQRRNFVYTITASACTLDDPADGVGPHDGTFCSDTATTSSKPADSQPQDMKRVTVDVSWTKPGVSKKDITLTTLIDNPGDAAGPSVTSLSTSAANPFTSGGSSIPFTFTTSQTAAAVNWSLNGITQTPAPTWNGSGYGFSWNIGDVSGGTYAPGAVLDGAYTIGAQAFDDGGSSPGARSLTVSLNRLPALKPTGFAAGWNGSSVDLEWEPNAEGDIIGYRVYRASASGDVLVWPSSMSTMKTDTTAQDTSPPNSPTLQYRVVALDTDPNTGQPREGTSTGWLTVSQGNQAPNPPTNLVASSSGNSTTLSWTPPSTPDADGDQIAFYRIYRDGQAYANRYDRTDTGADTTYTDTNTGGTQHTYWVVAVDPGLAESSMVGPVTK